MQVKTIFEIHEKEGKFRKKYSALQFVIYINNQQKQIADSRIQKFNCSIIFLRVLYA